MSHGDQQTRLSPSTKKNDIPSPFYSTTASLPSGTSGTPPEVITSDSQEERVHIFKRVEQTMDSFRKGQSTRFQTLSNVIDKLDKWSDVTDGDREQALNAHMAELNASPVNLNGNDIGETSQPSRPNITDKQRHSDHEHLINHLSRAADDKEEDESVPKRKRAREEDMPWYSSANQSTRRDICI
jgi:hypothetical protein